MLAVSPQSVTFTRINFNKDQCNNFCITLFVRASSEPACITGLSEPVLSPFSELWACDRLSLFVKTCMTALSEPVYTQNYKNRTFNRPSILGVMHSFHPLTTLSRDTLKQVPKFRNSQVPKFPILSSGNFKFRNSEKLKKFFFSYFNKKTF